MTNTHGLFVYGTLKRDYGNNRLLRDGKAEFICEALSQDFFQMRHIGFPVIVPASSSKEETAGVIRGELYKIDDQTLARCDILEGHPRMYKRTAKRFILCNWGTGVTTVQAWVYIWNNRLQEGMGIVRPNVDNELIWRGEDFWGEAGRTRRG